MLARRASFDQAWTEGSSASRAQARHHEHGVHEPGRAELGDESLGADLTERRTVHRGQHERLARRPALEDARELEQRGGVGGAAGAVRHGAGVASRDDHDLAA